MSILSLETRPAPFFYKGPSATTLSLGGTTSIQEHPSERYSTEGGMSSEDGRAASSEVPTGSVTMGSAPAFGEGNSLLAPTVSKDINKKKKPKNNVTKSNSSFISRVIVNDNLTRKLTDRPSDGLFAFANINRAFQWLDMSSPTKVSYSYAQVLAAMVCLGRLTPITARLPDKDSLHQGPLLMPRCQHGHKERFAYRRDYGFLHRRDYLVGAHFSAIYTSQ